MGWQPSESENQDTRRRSFRPVPVFPRDQEGGFKIYGLIGRFEELQFHQIGNDLERFQLKGARQIPHQHRVN